MNTIVQFSDLSRRLLTILSRIDQNTDLSLGKLKVGEQTVKVFFEDLNAQLRDLTEAFSASDAVLIGDLLEYEVAPRIELFVKYIQKIKEMLERSSKRGVGITSTNLLKPGQPVVITFPDGMQIQSKVLANLKNALVCSAPDGEGNKTSLRKRGTKIKALLWRANDSGYVFASKIISNDQIKGQPAFLIQHSRTLKRNQQRKSRRRPLARNCYFYPIEVMTVGAGRKARRKAFIQRNFKHLGNFIDISGGGCSINSQAPLDRGKLLMIEFEINRGENLTAYGKVKRVAQAKGLVGIMHIMFTKVTSRHMNNIYSYVYNYVKPSRNVASKSGLNKTPQLNAMRR